MERTRCCGTCKCHCYANLDGDWICENEESENYMCWTDYEDSCDEWEERK